MKKVLGAMAGIIFSVFCIAILGLLMSFTMGALRKLFPDSFINQMWGLVLFDIAAMVWGLAFVFKSESTGQYATAGIGFITGFVGTLLMVAFEVITSGQTFVGGADSLGRWAVYGFIIVTAIHAALVYFHHAAAPEIHQKINVGIARGEITTEAIRQATSELEAEKRQLAEAIHSDIVDSVKRDLGISSIAVDPKVGFVQVEQPAKKYQFIGAPNPIEQPAPKPQGSLWDSIKGNLPWTRKEQTVVQTVDLKDKPARIPEEVKAMYTPGTRFNDGTTSKASDPYMLKHCPRCKKETQRDYMGNCSECHIPYTYQEEPPAGDAPFPGPKE